MDVNKKIITLFYILVFLVCPFYIASAQLHPYGPAISYVGILDGILSAVWIIFTAVVVISFVVAGILFLTAGGAPDKIKTAKAAFIWGVAGVVVGIIAYSIIGIVGGILTGGNT